MRPGSDLDAAVSSRVADAPADGVRADLRRDPVLAGPWGPTPRRRLHWFDAPPQRRDPFIGPRLYRPKFGSFGVRCASVLGPQQIRRSTRCIPYRLAVLQNIAHVGHLRL
jgi:hypothetical protein